MVLSTLVRGHDRSFVVHLLEPDINICLYGDLCKEAFKYTLEEFTGKRLNLMSRKGMYPYDYMDCFEKFDQTELPTKEQFYSILNDQHVTNGNTTMQGKFGKPSTLR